MSGLCLGCVWVVSGLCLGCVSFFLAKYAGQTAWQDMSADFFANHLCRPCWPLPLPRGFALISPGVLSIPRLPQLRYVCIYVCNVM